MYLDANVFIFAANDSGKKGDAARALLLNIISESNATTSVLTLDEVMWALRKNGRAQDIRTIIESIYAMTAIEIVGVSPSIPMRAMDFMEQNHLRPRDAFHAAIMHEHHIKVMASDDADFDKVPGIKRVKF
jgi:predicted nucleic acid-binding protein